MYFHRHATRCVTRVFALSSVFAAAALSACGGSGSSPSPRPPATPTATPTATASPTGVPQSTTLQYAGTMTQTISTTYADTGPVPSGTPQAAGVQTLSWQSQQIVTSSPAPQPNAVAEHVVDTEVQLSPLQTTQATSDAIFQYPASGVGNVDIVSSTTTGGTPGVATSDTTVATTYGSGNGLVDILPESAGTSWTNNGAIDQTETDPDGGTVKRSITAGGAYTSTASSPVLGGGANVTTRTITDDADGSGSYVHTDLIGGNVATISYAAPQGGSIVITVSPSSQATTTTTIPVWFGVPVALYSESDAVAGTVAVPASCALGAQYGTTATEIDFSSTRTDTVLGTIETQTRKTFDAGGTVVCVQFADTIAAYYDYSGANVALVNFFGTDWQTTTTTQTLTLVSGSGQDEVPAGRAVRPEPVAFEAAVARVRRARERSVAATLSLKELH